MCFVTGASGFIGANLVHELLAHGHGVRALVRPSSDLRGLKGADYEPVVGDVNNGALLRKAMAGCDWCFHLAASYHLWLRNYGPMYGTNVEGTRAVLAAACHAGCARIVHTSTVGCIGSPMGERGTVAPSDETVPLNGERWANHYKQSKWQAEEVALGMARAGHPVVVVNPSAPVGPRDVKPTPTGNVILQFLRGAMPAYIDTGLNWVHVRDVVTGHILAAEKGVVGERYILGNEQGNWTIKEVFRVLSEISGVPAPRVRLPYWAALSAAYLGEGFSRVTGRPPKAVLGGVRMARRKMYFTSRKAIRELGLPQTPPRQALEDAVEWFRVNGYVKR